MRTTTRQKDFAGKKKRVVVATAGLLAVAGGAVAYWTSVGSGDGSASTGATQAVVVNQTSAVAGLAPGSAAQALSGDFTNTANSTAVYIASVTAEITGVTKEGDPVTDACASDYTITGTAPVGAQVPTGTHVGSWSGLSIALTDSGVNQDACKGATVTIAYTANAS